MLFEKCCDFYSNNFMKIEFENSIRRLIFLCCLPDIKNAWINPWWSNMLKKIVITTAFFSSRTGECMYKKKIGKCN